MTPSKPLLMDPLRDKSARLTQLGTAFRAACLALGLSCFVGACSESGSDARGGEKGSGGSESMHEDLTGTGTECSPREVCTGDSTGCTECPDTKLCVVNILSGASVSVGGAGGAESEIELTTLRHDCIERPGGCAADDCECLSEHFCFSGTCTDGLPSEYRGVGNLVEVSEGGAYCYQFDG